MAAHKLKLAVRFAVWSNSGQPPIMGLWTTPREFLGLQSVQEPTKAVQFIGWAKDTLQNNAPSPEAS